MLYINGLQVLYRSYRCFSMLNFWCACQLASSTGSESLLNRGVLTNVLNIRYSGYIGRKNSITNIIIEDISGIFSKYRISISYYKSKYPILEQIWKKQIRISNTCIHYIKLHKILYSYIFNIYLSRQLTLSRWIHNH